MAVEKVPPWAVPVTTFVASSPIWIGSLYWISSLPLLVQFSCGIWVGLAVSVAFHFFQNYRSFKRRHVAINTAQLCTIDEFVLSRLLPNLRSARWAQQNDFEKVNWLNKQLEEIWPSLNEAVSSLLKDVMQPVLDSYKFSVIQKIAVESVTLGKSSPVLGVRFSDGLKDESVLEIELDWRNSKDQKIILTIETSGPLLTAQIKDLIIHANMKMIFKPLQEEFPGFGAVILSFMKPPKIDFQTKFLGGDILQIPGVDNMIDNIILMAITDILVWPNRLVIPVMEGDYSYLALNPVGHLEVTVVEAEDLPSRDYFGKSDPYTEIYIRRKQGCIKKTSIKSNTHSPIWNEMLILNVEHPETQMLTIRVMDDDPFKSADLIGGAVLALKQFQSNKEFDLWVDLHEDLQKTDQKPDGRLHLVITYKPFDTSDETKDQ
eukprot:Gb_37167 [translate_table: standard]